MSLLYMEMIMLFALIDQALPGRLSLQFIKNFLIWITPIS
jgi:hypothetical protein